MARRVFFSFEYSDVWRAMVVRNSGLTAGKDVTGFVDKADFEAIERQGEAAVKRWIDGQLDGTSVTAVLVGANTCASKWVNYEIQKSIERGNGLLGISLSGIKGLDGTGTKCCGRIPAGYPFYDWVDDNGFKNLGDWVEAAASAAGR